MKRYWRRTVIGVAFLLIISKALKPEYRVVYQPRSSGGDYTVTYVCVVVKHTWFREQLDKMADEVIREHRRINYDTTTNEITLVFYKSLKDFGNGISWKEYKYSVDGNKVERISEDS